MQNKLWDLLSNSDLLIGEQPILQKEESPWFVKILLGFSGWLAAIFLLLSLGAMFGFVFEKPLACVVLGIIFLSIAYQLLRKNQNEFFENLAFVLSLASQALIFYAIAEIFENSERLAMLVVICVQIALFILIPHFLHRVFSAGSAAITFLIFASTFGLEYLASSLLLLLFVYLSLNEFTFGVFREKVSAAIYGIVFIIIPFYVSLRFQISKGFYLDDLSNPELFAKIAYWGGELFLIVSLLYCLIHLLKRLQIKLHSRTAIVVLLTSLILAYLGSYAAGVTLSVIVLLCGFANSNRILQGIAIAALLFFTSQYYYSLQITLLEKSQHLLILGVSLLLIRWLTPFLLRNDNIEGENKHV